MNIQARYNYQKGVPQDLRSEATTYNIENEIDRYIVAKMQIRDNAAENRIIIKEKDIEQAAYSAAEAAINELLKDF